MLLLSLGYEADEWTYAQACIPQEQDGMRVEAVCEFAAAALALNGHDPGHCFGEWHTGCQSKLGAVIGLLRCESWLHPNAYHEGYVAGTWNESRGIAQISNGWVHMATDEQAFNWRWSIIWLVSDLERVTRNWYPECGR